MGRVRLSLSMICRSILSTQRGSVKYFHDEKCDVFTSKIEFHNIAPTFFMSVRLSSESVHPISNKEDARLMKEEVNICCLLLRFTSKLNDRVALWNIIANRIFRISTDQNR